MSYNENNHIVGCGFTDKGASNPGRWSGPCAYPGDAAVDAFPGKLMPEDLRVLGLNRRAFPALSPRAEGLGAGSNGAAHPVVVAVLACLEALDAVRGVSAVTLTGREIRLMLLALAQITAAVFALKLRLLAAAGTHRVADQAGATSTATWLAHLTQTDRPEATAQVRAAQDLEGRYPLLADALAAGRVSPEQVKVCLQALRRLPRNLAPDQLEACQRFLIDAAQRLTPRQLKTVGRKLWEVIDPDGAEAKDGKDLHDEEQLARAKAYFRSWRNGDGTTGFRGKLPDLHADILIKIITAHASPRRVNNPNIPTSQPDNHTHTHPHNNSPASSISSSAITAPMPPPRSPGRRQPGHNCRPRTAAGSASAVARHAPGLDG